jgi:DNA-binding protein HU-beta
MNKAELVEAIASTANITKKQADLVLNATLEAIVQEVSDGNKVQIMGFGSFEARQNAAREGRNPKTGEPMTIPARIVPKFHAGQAFKERVADA